MVVWQWIVAHQGVVAGFVVGALDLIFALVPSLEANGILHQVYLWVKSLVTPKASS